MMAVLRDHHSKNTYSSMRLGTLSGDGYRYTVYTVKDLDWPIALIERQYVYSITELLGSVRY